MTLLAFPGPRYPVTLLFVSGCKLLRLALVALPHGHRRTFDPATTEIILAVTRGGMCVTSASADNTQRMRQS